jgi:hypothetical protein
LLTAERKIVSALQKTLAGNADSLRASTLKNQVRSIMLRLALRLPGLKFKVPPTLPPPPAPETIEPLPALRTKWAGIRRELEQVLNEFPSGKLNHTVFRHPRAGWRTTSSSSTAL